MIIKPMIRGNICLNAHPAGCKKSVLDQIAYVQKQADLRKTAGKSLAKGDAGAPKNVLVLGCSNGYGLASRIVSAFGYGASTIGVSFEKAGTQNKWGTPGWYNNLAFDSAAKDANLFSLTIDGDAFSHAIKDAVIDAAKAQNMQFDLVVYSLASPVRVDPDTGTMYKSVLKPTGKVFAGSTIDPFTGELKEISAEPATDEEILNTQKVMGGEDWALWIKKLQNANVLANGCMTVAYSYVGPEVSHAIYRSGTIGKAKEHLEKSADDINAFLTQIGGSAFVSVNKGLVTRASAVIPIIPLYLSVLYKVMKEHGTHEGCIEQINRLFAERLYISNDRTATPVPTDDERRIRIDDLEMDEKIQAEVSRIMPTVTSENSSTLTDLDGYRHDFLATSGFDIAGVDYDADIEAFDRV